MKLPRLDPATRILYESSLPKDGRIQTRAMFGGLGAFVNGNMFAGALGAHIFIRLPERDRSALLAEPGGGPFEPVKGHAMAEYATIPASWAEDPNRVREWVARSLAWVAGLPPKQPARRGARPSSGKRARGRGSPRT